ncbi:phage major capsid protein [Gordonia sp. N1V]|uniref:phage major capsid protein n=1 Tax=Gordonia sp. N1V TaxID=3034163 RepID=UPI0023E27646|nr:phage major capsid protein [Gordonia sp. N1V]MDF3280917.1 phage major capsid protein [Gordonia sp. N1V]
MPTAIALQTRGRELNATLEGIKKDFEDGAITASEFNEKLDVFQKDFDTHQADVAASERASELRQKLGANPTGSAEETAEHVAKAFNGDLAMEILNHESFANVVKSVGGRKGLLPRGQFRAQFEIGRKGIEDGEAIALKDSTSAANLIGEGLNGTTGPTALGQNVFLTGNAGPAIWPHQVPGLVDQRFYPLTIESLFTSSPTESPSITYLMEALFTNNAAETAEGGQYPYSSDQLARAFEQVGKITNAIKLTDETLQDADQFVSFVRGRLVLGVQRKKESALLAGSGYPGVNGLLNRSNGFTKVGGADAATGTNVVFPAAGTAGAGAAGNTIATLHYGRQILGTGSAGTAAYADSATTAEGIFQAMTDVMYSSFVVPDTIVINPVDWQTIRLGKDKNGQYYGGSFFGTNFGLAAGVQDTLWGKRVVVTPAIPRGTVLVGSFDADVANIFRRQGLSVEMTNSNGTDFEHGEVTVRAEERLALAVYRPAAFELIQLVNGSGS